MLDLLYDFYEIISLFDLIYLITTILSLIKCSRKGFVLSILAASKWLLAYVITLIIFPKIKPYLKGIIDNEYILDIFLGLGIFGLVIFIILIINKTELIIIRLIAKSPLKPSIKFAPLMINKKHNKIKKLKTFHYIAEQKLN